MAADPGAPEGERASALTLAVLPYAPDEALIKRHLVHCLEMHYGDLSAAVVEPDEAVQLLRKIAELTNKYRQETYHSIPNRMAFLGRSRRDELEQAES